MYKKGYGGEGTERQRKATILISLSHKIQTFQTMTNMYCQCNILVIISFLERFGIKLYSKILPLALAGLDMLGVV